MSEKVEILRPQLDVVSSIPGIRSLAELAAEPCLFSCDMTAAEHTAGDLTLEILEHARVVCKARMKAAYAAGLQEVIDVRVQRLMPGMFPSIPGRHCDAVPRAHYYSQPDFSKVNPASFHVTCLLDTCGRVSNTVFLDQEVAFRYNADAPVWRQLHDQLAAEPHHVRFISPGQLATFDSYTPHKTMPCDQRGWRLFFRLSMYHNPPVANKVPSSQQVYLLSEANGW